MTPSYNLLHERWIPVSTPGGGRHVSLRELFADAVDLTQVAHRSPAVSAAVFLHVVLGGYLDLAGVPITPEEWKQRWDNGRIEPDAIDAWVDEVEARFDLFDPVAPFAQVADLEATNGEYKSVATLDPYRELGSATPLFWVPVPTDEDWYNPADATALLIHALAYDTAGIKTGAVGDPEVKGGKLYGNQVGPRGQVGSVIPVGRNLFETILLNTPIVPDGLADDDAPHWRRPPVAAAWETREPAGPLEWLTWMSRRVRLVAETADNGKTIVTAAILAGGDRFTAPMPAWELHSAWNPTKKPKPDDPPWRPRRHRSGRTAWQGMDALVAVATAAESTEHSEPPVLLRQVDELNLQGAIPTSLPLNVWLIGYEYGTQSAVFENLISDSIPFPVAALRADSAVAELIDGLATSADQLIRVVDRLDADLRRAEGGDPTPWDKGQRPGTRLVQRLDPIVRRILAGLQADPERVDAARVAWHELAKRETRALGQSLLVGLPPSAHVGRVAVVGNKERVVRASTAELTFAWGIRQALDPFAADEDGDKTSEMSTEEASA